MGGTASRKGMQTLVREGIGIRLQSSPAARGTAHGKARLRGRDGSEGGTAQWEGRLRGRDGLHSPAVFTCFSWQGSEGGRSRGIRSRTERGGGRKARQSGRERERERDRAKGRERTRAEGWKGGGGEGVKGANI